MSVVVAVKYNNGVILGADRQVTAGHIKDNKVDKIYKSTYSNTAFGIVGKLRDLDIISCNVDDLMNYKDILDNVKLNKKYVVNVIVVQIFDLLMKYNRAYKIDNIIDIDSSVLVADDYSIFTISPDGSVAEYDTFAAIGCGDELVKGYLTPQNLEELSEPEAIDLVKRCIEKACKNDCFIDNDITIINLKHKRGR